MESAMAQRTWGLTVIAVLALIQSLAGVLRALRWIDIGTDLLGQGLLLLPAIGLVAIFRGTLVGAIALLYVVFACGALLRSGWAWWLGLFIALINLLLALSVMIQGESPARAVLWTIVPMIMICYLISSSGRQALTRGN